MTSILIWTFLGLSIWTWSPADAIGGGRRVPDGAVPGSVGRLELNGNFFAVATGLRAYLHGERVDLAISATNGIINATEKLRFVSNVVDRMDNKDGFISEVKRIHYRPNFNSSFPNRNNIIICILKRLIPKYQTTCVLANRTLPVNTKVYVAGWGATISSPTNAQLRKMNVAETRIGNSNECAAISRSEGLPARVQVADLSCVRNEVAGPCANDRGAASYVETSETPCLITGVVASGGNCGCHTIWSVVETGYHIWRWLISLGYWGTDLVNAKVSEAEQPRKPQPTVPKPKPQEPYPKTPQPKPPKPDDYDYLDYWL